MAERCPATVSRASVQGHLLLFSQHYGPVRIRSATGNSDVVEMKVIATIGRKKCEGNGREIQALLKKDIQTLLNKGNVTVESSMNMNHLTMTDKKPLMGAGHLLWYKDPMTITRRSFCGCTNGSSTSSGSEHKRRFSSKDTLLKWMPSIKVTLLTWLLMMRLSFQDTCLKLMPIIKDHLLTCFRMIAERTREKLVEEVSTSVCIFITGSVALLLNWIMSNGAAAPKKSSAQEDNLSREKVIQFVDEKYPVLKNLQSAYDDHVAKNEVAKDGQNKSNKAVMDDKGEENGEAKGIKAAVRVLGTTMILKLKSVFCQKREVAVDGEADSDVPPQAQGTKAA